MKNTRLAALLTAVFAIVPAAQGQKKALTQADWDKWKAINAPALSNDGKWAAYTLIPQVGDGELVIRATSGTTEFHVPRGYLGRPNNVPGGLRGPAGGTGEGDPVAATASPAQITADSRFVVVSTQASQAEVERAGRGRGAAATNRQSLAIVSLPDGKVTTIAGVRSFRLARANGTWLAYVPEPDSTTPGDSSARGGAANATGGGGRGRGGRGGGGAPSNRRQFGSPLVLRNLATGAEERLTDVLAFAFDDSAKVLAYTVVSRDSTKDGAFLRAMAGGTTTTLLAGRGDYKAPTFDRTGTQLVFLSDHDSFGHETPPRYALYQASTKGGAAQAIVNPSQVTPGMHIADNGPLAFTRSGTAITFNVAPPPIDSVPADSLVGKAVFDLWHYKDPVLQPTQRINAQRDRNKSYQATFQKYGVTSLHMEEFAGSRGEFASWKGNQKKRDAFLIDLARPAKLRVRLLVVTVLDKAAYDEVNAVYPLAERFQGKYATAVIFTMAIALEWLQKMAPAAKIATWLEPGDVGQASFLHNADDLLGWRPDLMGKRHPETAEAMTLMQLSDFVSYEFRLAYERTYKKGDPRPSRIGLQHLAQIKKLVYFFDAAKLVGLCRSMKLRPRGARGPLKVEG